MSLLGAPPWYRAAKAHNELGWSLSGYCRAVRDMALRRDKVDSYPAGDVYATWYHASSGFEDSWFFKSKSIIVDMGLPLPEACNGNDYKEHLSAALENITEQELSKSIAASSSTPPYSLVQAPVSSVLAQCKGMGLQWDVLVNMRSWMRMRAGFMFCWPKKGPAVHVSSAGPAAGTVVSLVAVQCTFWASAPLGLQSGIPSWKYCRAVRADRMW